MERIYAMPISKVKRGIPDRFCAMFWFSENTYLARRGGKWVAARTGNHGDINRELKQQRRRRLRKGHLKSEFALPQTLSRLFHLIQFVKCCKFVFGVEYQSSEKKRNLLSRVRVFDKHEITHFHVVHVVVQRRLRNVQKSVMHVQRCCSAHLKTYCFFAVVVAWAL